MTNLELKYKRKNRRIAKVVGDRHMEIANLADNEKDQANMSKYE